MISLRVFICVTGFCFRVARCFLREDIDIALDELNL